MTAFSDDDKELVALGYLPSFKREFSNLATASSWCLEIRGLCSSIATTLNTPLLTGGPSSVVWCWILGASMCLALGSSIAEIVSAYPTSGGMYTASARLTPKKYRARVGWLVGWLNILGQIAGVSSTEFGLANMIWAAVVIGKAITQYLDNLQTKTVWLFVVLLIVHGFLNCLGTRWLARLSSGFVFVNLGATILIIIVLLATTPRSEMHTAAYVFGSEGIVNQTGGWNNGLAFVFGLLSVQWTVSQSDYDATAHICEEVKRAAYAAPSAIFIAVIGTGLLGWLLNIVIVLCSGPIADLPGTSGSAFLQVMFLRMGKAGSLILWVPVCFTAFFVVQTAIQAASRTIYAFSRDHGSLPDRGFFGYNSKITQTPLRSIILCTLISIIPGLLDLASPIAANAIFALTAMALDLSYIIPIFLRRVFQNHPEVMFKPGPFYMGDGILGWGANCLCICWTLFVCVIFSFPVTLPVTPETMNYASVITVGVMVIAFAWYIVDGHRHYHGPQSNLHRLEQNVEQEKEEPGKDSEDRNDSEV
ncbi:APC amino acid permease [Lentinula aciculospora]|uniref:APC amino acid permease n=1 Tax=Lentinula aciculospora TaxID=153920 RepID=A0A9W9AEL1_9AGAR|nr:APC amino acid permease [Lentinula aciculospora]